jgi:hypothetical protein
MIATRQLELTPPAPPRERMVLRPYQNKAVVSIAHAWSSGKNRVLLVAPTGSGKTAMACALVAELERRARPALFLVHRDVLIEQTVESMARWGLDVGYIKAGYRENRDALVQVGSVQSLARRDWWGAQEFDWDTARPTMILDEAHTTAWSAVVRSLLDEHPLMRVVGLTATPWRLSRKEDMGDVFDAAALSPFPAQLIADGFLVPPAYYGVKAPPDLSGVRTRGGEFVEEDLARACDTAEMVRALVDDYTRLAPGTRALAFTVTVAHAHHVAAECARRGIPAAAVSGETPLDERRQHYDALRAGNAAFEARKAADDEQDETTKMCPQCQRVVKRTVPVCSCGYLWPLPKMGRGQHTQALVRRDLPAEDRVLAYRDLLRESYLREYKPEAAAVRYRDAFGAWPERTWTRGAVLGLHPTQMEITDYQQYLEDVAAQKEIDAADGWVAKWLLAECGEVTQ